MNSKNEDVNYLQTHKFDYEETLNSRLFRLVHISIRLDQQLDCLNAIHLSGCQYRCETILKERGERLQAEIICEFVRAGVCVCEREK